MLAIDPFTSVPGHPSGSLGLGWIQSRLSPPGPHGPHGAPSETDVIVVDTGWNRKFRDSVWFFFFKFYVVQMDVSKNRVFPKNWMVYNGSKPY